ncbi:cupin domain-containing protein [Flavobacterium agrisoli]|uniref:Cupin domain-containing protein n=1 Tax=Flavobacterium agrisoli TaxID=2793066 RepID=A0A934PNE8_9FLAO|nr:cupin domain-containing protein [Flavobacterium agrisoli]MBK0370070.1 cupin domain-containing protein [Flavobacterium agrisoli]
MEVIKHNENFEAVNGNMSLQRKIIHLEQLMVTVIEITDGPMKNPDPFHSHPHEQISYIAEGSLKLFIEDREYLLQKGDVFKVASNLKHAIQTLTEKVTLVDGFSPIREDFLNLTH